MTPALFKQAAKSTHSSYFHAAQVKRGGAVLSSGHNNKIVHAEVHALKKLWPSERIGTTVISIRMTRGGNLGLAKPCDSCELYMRRAGVKKVIYSTREGTLAVLKLR